MVPLTIERRLRARTRGSDVSLSLFRAAAEALPGHNDPLPDRLFALECLLRAGHAARAAASDLLNARQDAQWYLEQQWQPDVPHLAVLGQAISTIDAAGEDPPADWAPRLAETAAQLASRRTRLGLASSPALLAPVLRGLGAARLAPPAPMLEAARDYLASAPEPVVTAELAEALARQRSTSDLARRALAVTFTNPAQTVANSIARWWLAERWQVLRGEPDPVNASDLETARAQALSSPPPGDAPSPAMLAEVAAKSIDRLVIVPSAVLGEARDSMRVRATVENLVWRVLFVWSVAALALAKLPAVLGWLHRAPGPPSMEEVQAAAGTVIIIVGAATATLVRLTHRMLDRSISTCSQAP